MAVTGMGNFANEILGTIEVSLKLLIEPILQQSNVPIVEVKTELRLANEYSTSWLCYSIDRALASGMKNSAASRTQETFLFFPDHVGILLDRQFKRPLGSENGQILIPSPLQHFQRKKRYPSTINSSILIEEIEFNIFENQRLVGTWSSDYLFPTERKPFTDETGTIQAPTSFSPYTNSSEFLPPGYVWSNPSRGWIVDICTESTQSLEDNRPITDPEGWSYGTDFGDIMKNYRQRKSCSNSSFRTTRRRVWMRRCFKEIKLSEINRDTISSSNGVDDNSGDEFQDDVDETKDDIPIIRTVEVFQNQRRGITMGWGSPSSFERSEFSNETGDESYGSMDRISPPFGYEWFDKDWILDREYVTTDSDGWSYGMTFANIMASFRNGTENLGSVIPSVRRRKYFRRSVQLGSQVTELNPMSNGDVTQDIAPTKLELYKTSKDQILKLCKERETLSAPVLIPWDQVVSVDAITRSVLMVSVIVHRYIVHPSKGELYEPIEIDIYVVDCPADQLSLVIKHRIFCSQYRESVDCLLTAKSMTGLEGVFEAYSTSEMSMPTLSHGSSTILQLEEDRQEIQSIISLIENESIAKLLQLHEVRCKLYISNLLASGLVGPTIDKDAVITLVDTDCKRFDSCDVDFEKKHQYLFRLAESRIRDFAVCGWAYRGEGFEECIALLINRYYFKIALGFVTYLGKGLTVSALDSLFHFFNRISNQN
jgi:hypothetical protein